MFQLLKKPIYTDWIFYLWILSIAAILPGTLFSDLNGGGVGSFLIAFVIQYLIFLVLPGLIRSGLAEKKEEKASFARASGSATMSSSQKRKEPVDQTETVSVKVCSQCGSTTGPLNFECDDCGCTTYVHKSVPKEPELQLPENKICPMCAEEIKYAAKKCRYCQHIFE
jgi:hypothetical protein